MTAGEIRLPGGQEPVLGGQGGPQLSGMEPALGGVRRLKADPRLVAMLLGAEDEREAAISHIHERAWERLYALELVKIISAREARRMRRKRWGYAYTVNQRIAAARALEAFGQAVAVEALVDALDDGAWWVGQFAMDALIAVGPPAVADVIIALDHGNPVVRRRAADVLGQIGDRRATGALMAAYGDETVWVRMRVIQALDQLGDSQAIPTLRVAMQDTDGAVARAAQRVLQRMSVDARGGA